MNLVCSGHNVYAKIYGECKDKDQLNSVQSSPKSHSWRVNLYEESGIELFYRMSKTAKKMLVTIIEN